MHHVPMPRRILCPLHPTQDRRSCSNPGKPCRVSRCQTPVALSSVSERLGSAVLSCSRCCIAQHVPIAVPGCQRSRPRARNSNTSLCSRCSSSLTTPPHWPPSKMNSICLEASCLTQRKTTRGSYLRIEEPPASECVALIAIGRYNELLDAWVAAEPSQWPSLAELKATFAFAEQEDCACGLPIWPSA